MKAAFIFLVVMSLTIHAQAGDANSRTPILIELFTSEGCSSCPPADRLLAMLDGQPVAGAELIVLSEHVDYWNHDGWKDPYSAHEFSERQDAYARRFNLDSVYTPQMIVDGERQFTGSNAEVANSAIKNVLAEPKVPIQLKANLTANRQTLNVHLELGRAGTSIGPRDAELYLALALNRAESHVTGGENSGEKLTHVSVVRTLARVGQVKHGQTFSKDVAIPMISGTDLSNFRLIAFAQEPHQGRILGAAMQPVSSK
jgi:hypothetical protein